ncbi:MAG TPA: ThuA domain-containing protein [Fimbriimonadaceae bacterium]|nr:ThuA domain-containing protein [Fimbriimonadaceae bacterium]HRJ97064.1 ThuA domain-containing protein [Fimbriimonadaceae bacterium]
MIALLAGLLMATEDWAVYRGEAGPGLGRHIVFLAGDEEYRSEEGLPQLAKILSTRHGFTCTVLFSLNDRGEIDPEARTRQPGLAVLPKADLCIMLLRFRRWRDEQMKHFVDYYLSGRPILGLRTSTHAFDYPTDDSSSPNRKYGWNDKEWVGGFGKQVLGETWVSHWGEHGSQATRGILEPSQSDHPILRGVGKLFGTTDVYEAHPPRDAEVLVRGQVLDGMLISSPPASGRKRTAAGVEQGLNDPMMPIVWIRRAANEAGKANRVVTCTMGAATDLLDENLRRLLVNSAYWLVGLEGKIPAKADVSLVGKYEPSPFGFGGFRKGITPGSLMAAR